MDSRIIKTALTIMAMSITALLIPVFGQWYSQQTGIDPIGFYMLSVLGGCVLAGITIAKIWGGID